MFTKFAERANKNTVKCVSIITLYSTLFLDIYFDKWAGPQWTFLLFYMSMNIIVSELVPGRFGYAFAILSALCRSYTGTIRWDGWQVEIWSAVCCILGFSMISYLVQKKNILLGDLRRSALTDSLTNLPNRRDFHLQLEHLLAHCQRRGESISIAYIDVDNFKRLNDNFGHKRGDQVLASIGKVISKSLRSEDIGARLGGDEFAVIFASEINSDGNKLSLIDRLKHDLDEMCKRDKYDVTFSIGVVNYNGEAKYATCDEVLHFADEMMYKVKKTSKNAIKIENFHLQKTQNKI
jgi:diguanylate cyclase (GGDEF)-like protein